MPSLVYSDTFVWNDVTVTVTVDDDAPSYPGQYLWNYHVTNDSFAEGISAFAVPVEDTAMVSNLGNSAEWTGSIGTFLDNPDLIAWTADGGIGGESFGPGPAAPPIPLGESANFWFTTPPTGVALTNGVITDGTIQLLDLMPAGFVATALDEANADPLRPLLVADTADKWNPNFGMKSLREAVKEANDLTPTGQQQRIEFTKNLGTITLRPDVGYRDLTLEKNIFIDGEGKGITIRHDASSPTKYRLFEVLANTNVTLKGLTLRDGEVDGLSVGGGAVLSNGNLTLENCVFSQNKAINNRGGAVYAASGTLTVSGSTFTGNSAQSGGGLYIGQRVTTTISSSFFVLNTATQSGPTPAAYGGAIYINSSSTATATNVTLDGVDVSGNSAISKGGGIYVSSTGQSGTVLTLTGGTTIHNDNRVTSSSGQGGGVYFGRGLLILQGVAIYDNTASLGGDIYLGSNGVVYDDLEYINYYEDVFVEP